MDGRVETKGRLPDFIIGGAPKCGTTSVHFLLGSSPEIGIPDDEVHFFDADDPIAHPDFLHAGRGGLDWYDPDTPEGLDWYRGRFAALADRPLVGEDSTLYLHSPVAPERIARVLPDAKLIFMLRDPVRRACSQYWHMVTRGRAVCGLETALSRHPNLILCSTYLAPLRRYLDLFGPERVRVCLFEDFLADRQGVMDGLCAFLGAAPLRVGHEDGWHNRTFYPSNPRLQLLLNRISRRIAARQYRNHFDADRTPRAALRARMHRRWFRHAHPVLLTATRAPPVAEETASYLRRHLSDRNRGLSDLLGRDLSQVWPGFEG
ncbi:sulfotransferase [Jannaschia sp. W003]|uniref:sulfotransferase family protein n=1 Tax=Jannaschia sp. W003 TaxID=2867012 RepID=UPI0021A402CF|nr:sulfotransferase [Jannaschia sp. W003]UWQ21559.1 sulfotransferase [Jannaschia sp. W003]